MGRLNRKSEPRQRRTIMHSADEYEEEDDPRSPHEQMCQGVEGPMKLPWYRNPGTPDEPLGLIMQLDRANVYSKMHPKISYEDERRANGKVTREVGTKDVATIVFVKTTDGLEWVIMLHDSNGSGHGPHGRAPVICPKYDEEHRHVVRPEPELAQAPAPASEPKEGESSGVLVEPREHGVELFRVINDLTVEAHEKVLELSRSLPEYEMRNPEIWVRYPAWTPEAFNRADAIKAATSEKSVRRVWTHSPYSCWPVKANWEHNTLVQDFERSPGKEGFHGYVAHMQFHYETSPTLTQLIQFIGEYSFGENFVVSEIELLWPHGMPRDASCWSLATEMFYRNDRLSEIHAIAELAVKTDDAIKYTMAFGVPRDLNGLYCLWAYALQDHIDKTDPDGGTEISPEVMDVVICGMLFFGIASDKILAAIKPTRPGEETRDPTPAGRLAMQLVYAAYLHVRDALETQELVLDFDDKGCVKKEDYPTVLSWLTSPDGFCAIFKVEKQLSGSINAHNMTAQDSAVQIVPSAEYYIVGNRFHAVVAKQRLLDARLIWDKVVLEEKKMGETNMNVYRSRIMIEMPNVTSSHSKANALAEKFIKEHKLTENPDFSSEALEEFLEKNWTPDDPWQNSYISNKSKITFEQLTRQWIEHMAKMIKREQLQKERQENDERSADIFDRIMSKRRTEVDKLLEDGAEVLVKPRRPK